MKTLSMVLLLGASLSAFGFENSANRDLDLNIDHGLENAENIQVEDSELFEMSSEKGFPSNRRVRAYDPVNRRNYQKVIVGPTKRATGLFKDYDYWRYVTVYNVRTTSERISYLPSFSEECHDDSWRLGGWDESRTITVTINSEVGVEALGLSASVGVSVAEGFTFSFSRSIRGTGGLEATHVPMKKSETWTGVTYIQTYNSDTRRFGYLRMPSYFNRLSSVYPYVFSLDNQNVVFEAKRINARRCPGYDSNGGSNNDMQLFLSGGAN